MEWADARYVRRANLEPQRLAFWRQYYPGGAADYVEACRAVVENKPSFDRLFAETFPDPREFARRHRARAG